MPEAQLVTIGTVQVDSRGRKSRGERVRRNEGAAVGVNEIAPGNIDRIGDVAKLLEWKHVVLGAFEFAGTARVDHLFGAG